MLKIYLPELGENITKATISFWYAQEGATVAEGSDLVEVATDKAVFNVPAPGSGTIIEIIAHEGEEVRPGEVLAIMEEDNVSDEPEEDEKQA